MLRLFKTQIVRINFLLEYVSEIYSLHGQLVFVKCARTRVACYGPIISLYIVHSMLLWGQGREMQIMLNKV